VGSDNGFHFVTGEAVWVYATWDDPSLTPPDTRHIAHAIVIQSIKDEKVLIFHESYQDRNTYWGDISVNQTLVIVDGVLKGRELPRSQRTPGRLLNDPSTWGGSPRELATPPSAAPTPDGPEAKTHVVQRGPTASISPGPHPLRSTPAPGPRAVNIRGPAHRQTSGIGGKGAGSRRRDCEDRQGSLKVLGCGW
jgi:hypothetical protein